MIRKKQKESKKYKKSEKYKKYKNQPAHHSKKIPFITHGGKYVLECF